jgi:hypothetical protein
MIGSQETRMQANAQADELVRFTATTRRDMEARLEAAVEYLRGRARSSVDRGILVTRHSPWDFTLELHESVPYGTTLECQEW